MDDPKYFEWKIKKQLKKKRFDIYLAHRLPEFSRTQVKKLIVEGCARINGEPAKPSYELKQFDVISVHVILPEKFVPAPENIPLDIIVEDEHLIVINKPAGLIMHPASGHWSGTLVNALIHHCHGFEEYNQFDERPGIVHRLDKDTSGVVLCAKNPQVQQHLCLQFENRTVKKEYRAIVSGVMDRDSERIDLPIGRHRKHFELMSVRHDIGKPAQTTYYVEERFSHCTLVRCEPHTGRTHQIRVHLATIGYPIIADRMYSNQSQVSLTDLVKDASCMEDIPVLDRQALHAHRLTFFHPITQKEITVEAPLPLDLQNVLDVLRKHTD